MQVIPYVNCLSGLEFILKEPAFTATREKEGYHSVICPSNCDSASVVAKYILRILNIFPECHEVHIGGSLSPIDLDILFSCPYCKIMLHEMNKDAIIYHYLSKIIHKITKEHPGLEIIVDDTQYIKCFQLLPKFVIRCVKDPIEKDALGCNKIYKSVCLNKFTSCFMDPTAILSDISGAIKEASSYRMQGIILFCPSKMNSNYTLNVIPSTAMFPLLSICTI